MAIPEHCRLCPKCCGANRRFESGPCHGGPSMRIALAAPHHWEEPCISGTRGSGAIFFTGCALGCSFCQNHTISRGTAGQPVGILQLVQIFLLLQSQGVHNINLVTAGHYRPWVKRALALARRRGLHLPVVWNTGGYETPDAIQDLQEDVDIWLTDIKFYSPALAKDLAAAPNYFNVASAAAQAMCKTAGPPLFRQGILQKGVIIRLLVLPGQRQDAKQLLHWMAEHLPKGGFLLSLMSQYTPPAGLCLPPPFNRRVASFEYNDVVRTAIELELTQGFMQQRSSAAESYTPLFDGTGVLPGTCE